MHRPGSFSNANILVHFSLFVSFFRLVLCSLYSTFTRRFLSFFSPFCLRPFSFNTLPFLHPDRWLVGSNPFKSSALAASPEPCRPVQLPGLSHCLLISYFIPLLYRATLDSATSDQPRESHPPISRDPWLTPWRTFCLFLFWACLFWACRTIYNIIRRPSPSPPLHRTRTFSTARNQRQKLRNPVSGGEL